MTIAQLEDKEVLDHLEDIVQVDRIGCLFTGRINLTLSLGVSSADNPIVIEAVNAICAAAQAAGRTIGMVVGDLNELPRWVKKGVSLSCCRVTSRSRCKAPLAF